jgi:D-alanyl-D-alanine carboxypeptidase
MLKMIIRSLLVLTAISTAAGSCANLKAEFEAQVASNKVGGIIRVQQRGKLPYTVFSGPLSIGGTETFTENTLFEVASVTKTFVAALILAKVQLGATTLDATAKSILGDTLPASLLEVKGVDKTNEVTLRQLLKHSSGLLDYFYGAPIKKVRDWYTELNVAAPTTSPLWATYENREFNRMQFLGQVRPVFETDARTRIWTPAETIAIATAMDSGSPGDFLYSDTNYLILAMVVEKLWQTSLNSAISENLLKPLNVTAMDTWMRYDVAAKTDQAITKNKLSILSHRYYSDATLGNVDMTYAPDAPITSYFWSADYGGGGMVSNAPDLGKFWMALMNSQTQPWKFVASEMRDSSRFSYGYGVFRESSSFFGAEVVGHSGLGGAFMWYNMGDNIVITGTTNYVDSSEFIKKSLSNIKACASAQSTDVNYSGLSSASHLGHPLTSLLLWLAAGISLYLPAHLQRMV